jgi:hypothetical protein
MSGFKKLKHPDKLALKQRGGAVVFLESGEDFQIVRERWFFDEGQDVWFQAADSYEPGTGGGGCKAVINLVEQARADGIKAFGLVDRDVLLNDHDWLLWWQSQDHLFVTARPYGAYIRVLLRWELENYLLDPETMKIEANDAQMTSRHSADSVLTSCLDCANELKDRTAATVAAKVANIASPAPGFGCNKPPLTSAALRTALQEFLTKAGLHDPESAMADERQRIEHFDAPTAPPRKRWELLLRMLDGKAALKYISHKTGIRFDERRAGLARRMYESRTIPAEIRGYIEEFKRAA